MDAVRQVMRDVDGTKREVEIKKYAKVEKIPGGAMQVRTAAHTGPSDFSKRHAIHSTYT